MVRVKIFSILNRALSWAITSFGNKFCLKMRSRLIKALNNRFYVKFMQLEIGLLLDDHKPCNTTISLTQYQRERLISLTSILYLSFQNCSTVTIIKTSIYEVNVKCAADTHSKLLL